LLVLIAASASGQYYLRGNIKDEKGQSLPNVRIFVHSSRTQFKSGSDGSFGINVPEQYDSLSFMLDGYEPKSMRVKTTIWQNIVLKITSLNVSTKKPKLISINRDAGQAPVLTSYAGNESYFELVENEFVNTIKYPNTGFSLNINKASYSNVRRFINMETPVLPDAVRIEEMTNYFNLHYREPPEGQDFSIDSKLTSCPWNSNEQLLFLNISAKKLLLNEVPPGNFVFLVDVSGSMDRYDRLPLLKAAFQLFVKNLRPVDTVSIVMYGGTVGIMLPPTSGAEKEKILEAIEALNASGDTPGESAIRTAYKLAESTFIEGGNNRVILATDGDFNVGESTEKSLDELITRQKKTGIYLTCLGVGMGNFKDSKLETLAKKGNGNYAYIDDIREGEKVLVKELTQNFYAVADNVFMNVYFNPVVVKEYRLIGFDNKKDALGEEAGELDGGEVGSGSSVMAIFELTGTENLTVQDPDLQELGVLSLKYSNCGDTASKKLVYDMTNNYQHIDSIDREWKFAAAVAMFGMKLKQSKYLNNAEWPLIKAVASAADRKNYLQNEFLTLVNKAEKIYAVKKKKKKKSRRNRD